MAMFRTSTTPAALLALLIAGAGCSALATGAPPPEAQAPALQLEYNRPVRVPPNTSVRTRTTQAITVLQIQNLSTRSALIYAINGGQILATSGTMPANDPTPKRWVILFKGGELVISNLSTASDTIMLVTLVST
jgi:hypothetical protein